MERMLQRMARQLAAYDEASLMSLWDKYYQKVETFQPTRQWEEEMIVLCLLQAVRWKNQLFNSKWAEQRSPEPSSREESPTAWADREGEQGDDSDKNDGGQGLQGRVISFPSRRREED